MKALILTTTVAITSFVSAPVQAAAECGTLNNGTQVCVSDGGRNADFMFAYGPAGGEFIRSICTPGGGVTYWESNGNNTQEFVEETVSSWCGG